MYDWEIGEIFLSILSLFIIRTILLLVTGTNKHLPSSAIINVAIVIISLIELWLAGTTTQQILGAQTICN